MQIKNRPQENSRIFYIDNLRIFLSFLVVAHHWALANGGPGDWYLTRNNLSLFGNLLLGEFVATNQAFFMGFFFLISGYLVPGSYDRKGGTRFLKERLIRLGIPLVFYILILSPVIHFVAARYSGAWTGNFQGFIVNSTGIFSYGPLWFVMLLLIFSLLYHLIRRFTGRPLFAPTGKQITGATLAIILLGVIVITYAFRIVSPVGRWLPVLGIQPAHVTQYVTCFGMGIFLYRRKSLEQLSFRTSRNFLIISQVLILVLFPALFLLTGKSDQTELFMGGLSAYSLVYTVWEQFVALGMIIGLLGIFARYFNNQTIFLKDLSRHSYALYVFHSLGLVALSIMLGTFMANPILRFTLLLLPALLLCYLLAKLILLIPITRRVL